VTASLRIYMCMYAYTYLYIYFNIYVYIYIYIYIYYRLDDPKIVDKLHAKVGIFLLSSVKAVSGALPASYSVSSECFFSGLR
jgi:hypothetical protein